MLSNIQTYKLSSLEWEQYKDIRLEALREDGEAFGDSYGESLQFNDSHWQEEFENPRSLMLVARDGVKTVALAAAYQEEGEKMRHIAYVWGVYVKKAYRGKGIGKKILVELIEEIKTFKGIEKIDLNVNTSQLSAVWLYEKLGFKLVGTLHNELKIGTQYFDEHVMEMFL